MARRGRRLAGHHVMACDYVKGLLMGSVGLRFWAGIGMTWSVVGRSGRIIWRVVGISTHGVIRRVLGLCGRSCRA